MRLRFVPALAALVLVACGSPSNNTPAPAPAPAPEAAPGELPAAALNSDVGEVIATVGEGKIGVQDFQMAAARTPPADGQNLTLDERKEIVDKLVVDEVLYQEAAKKGLYKDPKVRKIMVNLLLREEVYATVRNSDFSNDELQDYYMGHKDEFVVPEKVQVKRIFIKVTPERDDAAAKTLATDLYNKVKGNPKSFSEVAAEFSEDPYKRRGGDLGYLSVEGKPGVDQSVVEKAFTLNVDQLTTPFEGGGGYNVILLAGKRERVERTFEQMKGSVLRKLKNERYKELTDEYIATVKGSYPTKLDEEKLGGLELRSRRGGGLAPNLDKLDPGPRGLPDLDGPVIAEELKQ
jgi:peptidyl-prolyl cis-trans isomerase C